LALSPAALLGALALVPLFVLSAVKGGFFPQEWYPAALFLVALLLVGFLALPAGGRPQVPVLVACGALAAFALWSYVTIAWADQRADAWDGANRTALYAVLFAIFALWRIRARAAVALVGAFAVGVTVIGFVELLSAARGDPAGHFIDGRLAEPVGYANANAALWSAAFWPCVVLGSRRETGPLLRALFVGSAVLLGGLALMGQSRGWLFALPVVALLFLLLTPQRVRTTLTLALILGALGVAVPAILDVYDEAGGPLANATDDAAVAIIGAAAVAAALAGMGAFADRAQRRSPSLDRWAGRVLGALAAVVLVVGSMVYVAERGSPFTDVADAWEEFKTTGTPGGGESRLDLRLGSNRYDFWRVAWDEFTEAPVAGIGADNFQQAYLVKARSHEQPRFPHSVELRTLSQTGLIGAALLALALGAAMVAALRALRWRSGPARAAAAGGLGVFVYWFVHGSVDWFWEVPALGGAAFALLGLAAGMAPRRVAMRPARRRAPLAGGLRAIPAVGLAVVLAWSLASPWLADRYVDQALDLWSTEPDPAFDKLDRAASLNRLSPDPDYAAGSIALRLDRPEEAIVRFTEAVEREPGDSASHLELGAVLFNEGERRDGLRHLREARRLDPRDEIIRGTLRRAQRGRQIDIAAMNEAIANRYRELGE
jgi:tetratricopeptide (TPR) repeat protein